MLNQLSHFSSRLTHPHMLKGVKGLKVRTVYPRQGVATLEEYVNEHLSLDLPAFLRTLHPSVTWSFPILPHAPSKSFVSHTTIRFEPFPSLLRLSLSHFYSHVNVHSKTPSLLSFSFKELSPELLREIAYATNILVFLHSHLQLGFPQGPINKVLWPARFSEGPMFFTPTLRLHYPDYKTAIAVALAAEAWLNKMVNKGLLQNTLHTPYFGLPVNNPSRERLTYHKEDLMPGFPIGRHFYLSKHTGDGGNGIPSWDALLYLKQALSQWSEHLSQIPISSPPSSYDGVRLGGLFYLPEGIARQFFLLIKQNSHHSLYEFIALYSHQPRPELKPLYTDLLPSHIEDYPLQGVLPFHKLF